MSDYCVQNCLIVSISKTNVLVFCKGKCPVVNIYYRSQLITQVNTYTFLGIVFSSNGMVHHCQEDLCKRALRAYFKLLKCISSCNVIVKSCVHLFDHTIKPVLLYACEIWGTFNTDPCIIRTDNYSLEIINNLSCDKLR